MAKLTRGSPLPWAWLSPEASWATHLIIDNLSMISEQEEEQNNRQPFKNGKCCTIFKEEAEICASLSLSLRISHCDCDLGTFFHSAEKCGQRRPQKKLFNCFSLCLFIVVAVLFRLLFIINCSTLVAALGEICGNFLATNFSNCLNFSRENYIK